MQIVITDRDRFSSLRFGVELAAAILRLHPGAIELSQTIRLIGNAKTAAQLENGEQTAEIWQDWQRQLLDFRATRARYLIYEPEGTP